MKIEKGLDFARAVLRLVEEERHRARIALSRILLLEPNRGSDLKSNGTLSALRFDRQDRHGAS